MAAIVITSPVSPAVPGRGPGHEGSSATQSTLLSGSMAPNKDGTGAGIGANLLSLQWTGDVADDRTKLDGSRGSASCPVPTANIELNASSGSPQLPRASSFHSRSGGLLGASRDPLGLSYDLQSSAIFADWRQSKEAMDMLFQEADGRAGRTTQTFTEWIKVRMPYYEVHAVLIFSNVVFALLCIIAEGQLQPGLGKCDILPVMTTASGVSLVVSLSVALAVKGGSSLMEIFYTKNILHFLFVALLMSAWIPCFVWAKALGATPGSIYTVGALYLPVSAVMSYFMMRRNYGALEGFSLMIMTLAFIILFHLRSDDIQGCDQFICTLDASKLGSAVLLLCGFVFLAASSMYAERVYKNQFFFRNNGNAVPGDDKQAIYINKAQLDFLCLVCFSAFWAVQRLALPVTPSEMKCSTGITMALSSKHAVWVAAITMLGWLTSLMSKYLSTVSRCICEVFVSTSVILCVFPLWGGLFGSGNILIRIIAIIMIIMAILSALVFQTGRLIIASVVEYSGMDQSMAMPNDLTMWQSFRAFIRSCKWSNLRTGAMKWGTLVLFIMSDAARAMASQAALGGLQFTPLTFAFMISVVGVVVASVTTVWSSDSWIKGLVTLKKAYHPRIIIRYFPCGFLFGITNVFTALAFSNGISAGMNTAIGYIYTPLAAVASAFVLRKYYMWLEWFGICILSCALTTFGLMTSFLQQQSSHKANSSSTAVASLYVVGSAVVSVVASLVSEKILKAEDRPFHEQKIALDFGSAISVLLVLYPVGWVDSDPKYSIDNLRPLSTCNATPCWKKGPGPFSPLSYINCRAHPGPTSLCSCVCESGFFAAWGESLPLIIFALAINVIQGWLTGMVIKQFSTVGRALAQSFTLLVIYFIGDHLIPNTSPHTMALALVAFSLPLSNMIFVNAAAEMQKLLVTEHAS